MQASYSPRKFSSPVVPPTTLHREALITKLDNIIGGSSSSAKGKRLPYKLVLLCAPAGYGKTTLLADFAQRTSMPCCWCFLDQTDTTTITFLESLRLSIYHCFPQFGSMLPPLHTNMAAVRPLSDMDSHAGIIQAFITSLSELSEPFAMFLCNYHEVNTNQAINQVMDLLLEQLPPQCVVVIESRALPELDFASLLARREIVGIDQHLLQFTTAEIRDLARIQGVASLSEEEAEQLATSFNGWITGILLGTRLSDVHILSAQRGTYISPCSLKEEQRAHQNLLTYVIHEVFKYEPDMYTFLREISILQHMTPALCDELLHSTASFDRLHYLETQGLFVTHHGSGLQMTYTCHPVLRNLLSTELLRQSPQRFTSLHQRAAELFHAAQEYEQAMYHAHAAHLYDLIASLVLQTYEQMLAQGRTETLARWIDSVPAAIAACYPKLLLIRANIYFSLGEHTLGLPLLETIAAIIDSPVCQIEQTELSRLQAELSIAHSKALFQMGEYLQAQALCEQALKQVPPQDVSLRAEAYTRLGVCENLLGNFSAGITHLQKALQLLGRSTEQHQAAELHSTLASMYSLIGNFVLADHHIARAILYCDQLQDHQERVNTLIRMGLIKQRQGLFPEAEAALTEALTIARGTLRFRRGEAYTLASLGELYLDQGWNERALVVAEDGLAIARQLDDKYLINFTLCILALAYLFAGDASTAMLFVSEIDLQAASGRTVGYERAIRELTEGTIFLYQHRFDEAITHLAEVKTCFKSMGLKREMLQAALRLATALFAQNRSAEAIQHFGEVVSTMRQHGYQHLVLKELDRLPALHQALRTQPGMLHFATDFQLPGTTQESEHEPQRVSASTAPLELIANGPNVKIQALGEPMVLLDEKPITRWRTARAMELLFFLLNNESPVHKEYIMVALWPEGSQQIQQALHSTIHYLRKALGEQCVVSQAGTYALDFTALYRRNIWYDVAVFEEHNARAKQALKNDDHVSARAAFLAMVNLYRGNYLQSVYSDWCISRREQLRDMYVDARHQLALIAWEQERFDECIIHWQQMLSIEPYLEKAHYGLMRCYYRLGKRELALRQYQRCTHILHSELATVPGAAIQNLYQRLMGSSSTS